jgi:serine/threonine protein phosphatase PrpC
MEDAHTTLTSLENYPNHSVFAVYDGHGGSYAAKYAGTNLHNNVSNSEEFKQKKYAEALKIGFLKTDDNLRKGNAKS